LVKLYLNEVKEVFGVELIQEIVDMAKKNAKINNIENCEFIQGNVFREVASLEFKLIFNLIKKSLCKYQHKLYFFISFVVRIYDVVRYVIVGISSFNWYNYGGM